MNKALIAKAQGQCGCLSHLATATGRRRKSTSDSALAIPDNFRADEAKIISSKAHRNMSHKTQVITAPTNTMIRNRMTHTMEVTAVSVVIADMLGLNASLARSIAEGHDIGHVPFGHAGEKFIAAAMGRPDFCHEIMGVVIAQKIERAGAGLNLTHETLEGMLRHSGAKAKIGMTPEAWIVRFADKIAYLFADYNDIERMGYHPSAELKSAVEEFGTNQRERNTTAMCGLIIESAEAGKVEFIHSELAHKFNRIRTLMQDVYPRIAAQEPHHLMEPVLEFLTKRNEGDPYMMLTLMTDDDIAFLASKAMISFEHFRQTAISEILPHLEAIGKIDLCDPDLNW